MRRLNVDNNQLASLPERLPATLQELDASGNRLTRLPGLPAGLQRLNVEYNQLTDLPEPLPAELEWLSASHNRLTSLPETVPPQLIWLGASNNQLTNMPETLLTQLSRDSSVNLENNPLADWVQAGLATAMHAGDYAGPQVFFSTADGAVEVKPRSLQEVAADWLEGEPTAMATWQHFAHEAGAADYARSLDRLRGRGVPPVGCRRFAAGSRQAAFARALFRVGFGSERELRRSHYFGLERHADCTPER